VPFSVQPQSSQSQNTSGRGYLTSEQQLDVIKWCLSHKKYYADRNLGTIGDFWIRCAVFIRQKFNKTYSAPERMVRTLENRRRQEIATGRASIASAELKQALDKWIQFLDDTKRRAEERKERISQPSLGEQARDMLCRRMAEQREARMAAAQQSSRPTQPTLGDQAREQLCRRMAKRRREAEGGQSDGDTTDSEASDSPRASERRRKKLRRQREQERERERYTTALSNALTTGLASFGTSFSKSLGEVLREPLQRVETSLEKFERRMEELDKRIEKFDTRMDEWFTRMNEKLDRFSQLLQERQERLNRKISKVEG
jgi:hypothetical protein